MHEIVHYIQSVPSSTWTSLLSFLGGSTLVASLLQVVKHKLNIAEAKSLVTFLLGLFSFLAAFANYILSATSQNPTVLGQHTAMIVAGAVFIHRFAVSPAYNKGVVGLSNLVNDAHTYRASVAPLSTTVGEAPEAATQFEV